MECTILSGYVNPTAQDKTVSLLLIANAESGKSELIKLLQDYLNTYYTNDLSFKGLIDEILPKIERDEITHILIPDFINVLSHRRASETLIPIMNSIMENELKDLKFYGSSRSFSKPIRAGIITGITKPLFESRIKAWQNNGFLSRILPLTFDYSPLTIKEINDHIQRGDYNKSERIEKNFEMYKPLSFSVEIPEDIGKRLNLLAETLKERNETYTMSRSYMSKGRDYKIHLQKYGFRLHKQLRSLIKGVCLYNCTIQPEQFTYTVTEKDFDDLMEFTKYMNFGFKEI